MHLLKFKATAIVLTALSFGIILSCKKETNPVGSTTPADVNLKKGLLVYLPFDGNFADSSGNGNPITALNNASLTYDEHGYANSAFGGTGNGERLLITNNGSIKFDTAFSVSYDFMIRSYGLQAFVSMINNNNGYGPTFISGTNVVGSTSFDFAANDTTAGCDNYGYLAPNSVNDTTQFVPQPESWYNAICIYHKGSIQVYINGKLIAAKNGTGKAALLCPASQVVIGGWWQGGPITINGKLDEVRLYNRVLNADEIAALSKEFQD